MGDTHLHTFERSRAPVFDGGNKWSCVTTQFWLSRFANACAHLAEKPVVIMHKPTQGPRRKYIYPGIQSSYCFRLRFRGLFNCVFSDVSDGKLGEALTLVCNVPEPKPGKEKRIITEKPGTERMAKKQRTITEKLEKVR